MKEQNKDQQFKYWVDTEFTIIHIYMAVIIGLLIHHWIAWVIIGLYILISFLYASVRVARLPRDYLTVRPVDEHDQVK